MQEVPLYAIYEACGFDRMDKQRSIDWDRRTMQKVDAAMHARLDAGQHVQGTAVPESGWNVVAAKPFPATPRLSAAIRQHILGRISPPTPTLSLAGALASQLAKCRKHGSASGLHPSAMLYPPIRSVWLAQRLLLFACPAFCPADWPQTKNDHREVPLAIQTFSTIKCDLPPPVT